MCKTSPLAPKNGFPVIKSISGVQFSDEAAGIKYTDRSDVTVSYTHLTLPTNREV